MEEMAESKAVVADDEWTKFADREDRKEQQRRVLELALAKVLGARFITFPLVVEDDRGLNDDLSGRPEDAAMTFVTPDGMKFTVVQSTAKYKRIVLTIRRAHKWSGIIGRMIAIRRGDVVDATHSPEVTQFEWETVIGQEHRTMETLHEFLNKIWGAICAAKGVPVTELKIYDSHDLCSMYPDLTPKMREEKIARDTMKPFAITRIGHALADGRPHDQRAPDYDDWNLNADMFVVLPGTDKPMEVMSMGIRVDAATLKQQLELTGTSDRLKLDYHAMVAKGELAYTIGGGIGIDRMLMYLMDEGEISSVKAAMAFKS